MKIEIIKIKCFYSYFFKKGRGSLLGQKMFKIATIRRYNLPLFQRNKDYLLIYRGIL